MLFPCDRKTISVVTGTVVVGATLLCLLSVGLQGVEQGPDGATGGTPPSKPGRPAAGAPAEAAGGTADSALAGSKPTTAEGGGQAVGPDRTMTLPDGRIVRASELSSLGFELAAPLRPGDQSSELRRQLLERAGRLASQSDQPWKQLILVALSYRQAGDREAMMVWFQRAIGLASHPNDPKASALALRDVVNGLLAAGEVDQAVKLTGRIPDEKLREMSMAQVVRKLAYGRDFERARNLAARLADPGARALALRGMAEAEARFGLLSDALAFLEQIPDGPQRDQALVQVAVARAASGDRSGASRLVELIDNSRLRDVALVRLARMPGGDRGVSSEVLLGLLHDPRLRDESLLGLVEERIARANLQGAANAAARIENRVDHAAAMEFLVSLELRLGKVPAALKRATGIAMPTFRDRALEQIALQQVVKQGPPAARLTAGLIEAPRTRDRAFSRIAERTASLGIDHQVDPALQAIVDPIERASALAAVARTQARRGLVRPAMLLLEEAEEEVARVEDGNRAARALSVLASAYATAGDEESAMHVAAAITNPGVRDNTYQQLSRLFARNHEIDLAEESAQAIGKTEARERTLDDLARVVAGRTRATEALRQMRRFDARRQRVKFLLEVARRI